MRPGKAKAGESTFDLNLAPFLDIIVSIIPMMLLSIAFIQIKMIEAPTPQVVNQSPQNNTPPITQLALKVSSKGGFAFEITDVKGQVTTSRIAMNAGQYDFAALQNAALGIKSNYPNVKTVQLYPEAEVAFDDLVKVMDSIREKPRVLNVKETADKTQSAESRELFPDIIFASVGG